jgi:hypothetical protein
LLKENESSIMDIETHKSSINQNSEQDVLFDTNKNDDSFYSNRDNQKSLDNILEI